MNYHSNQRSPLPPLLDPLFGFARNVFDLLTPWGLGVTSHVMVMERIRYWFNAAVHRTVGAVIDHVKVAQLILQELFGFGVPRSRQ
jgi:hypothetical protein